MEFLLASSLEVDIVLERLGGIPFEPLKEQKIIM
jgi:hypothetical protein